MRTRVWLCMVTLSLLPAATARAIEPIARVVRIREIASVAGVRDNLLVGYGLVVGLNKTGDSQQTLFSTQTLENMLQKLGVQLPASLASTIQVKNVAGVMVTSSLPPFSEPGTQLDVAVSSIGDAKSLQGGLLILTSLHGPDGQVYATAQGPVVLGGYSAGERGNSVQVNHPTAGLIPNGGIVERGTALDLAKLGRITLLLRNADFQTAVDVAAAINEALKGDVAKPVDGRRIDVQTSAGSAEGVTDLLSQIEALPVTVHIPAKVIVNERTGTIVMGQDVTLGACSILHGNLTVDITTQFQVSQPAPLSQGQTVVVPKTTVAAQESVARRIEVPAGASVKDLIAGLQSIGATARDIVAIIEAVHAAGALQAELEVI